MNDELWTLSYVFQYVPESATKLLLQDFIIDYNPSGSEQKTGNIVTKEQRWTS